MKQHRSGIAHETKTSPLNGQRGCHGKRQYDSYAIADTMAGRVRRQCENVVTPYKCRCCGKFHVGGAGQRVRLLPKNAPARAFDAKDDE